MLRNDFLWTELYRPHTIEDTILTPDLKKTFSEFVNNKEIPNMILAGGAGVGKTTVAKAMLEQLGNDYIVINGSMNGNIDTLRNDIMQFASSVSLMGGRKYVILDEADYLNPNSTQPALRNFMEEYSRNCGFILTCNFKNRIIDPLHSRCTVIDFNVAGNNKAKMASSFMKRIEFILKENNTEYDKAVLAEVIMKHFPDFRRVLNELQRYSVSGKIDSGILVNLKEVSLTNLVKHLKEKDFGEMRKWVANNLDNDISSIFRSIYNSAHDYMEPASVPQLVLILADYQYKQAFVVDSEINLTACLTEIMVNCKFK